MNIVYFVPSLSINNDPGVFKKILNQIESWNKLDSVSARAIVITRDCIEDVTYKNIFFIKPTLSQTHIFKLFRLLNKYKPDLVYMRYFLFKPYYYILQKKYKTFFEINTDDVEEWKMLSKVKIKFLFYSLYNFFSRGIMYKNACAFLFVTHELSKKVSFTKYAKPFIISPNSINLSAFKHKKCKNIDKKLKFFFIGSSGIPWHGLDKIEYLAQLLGNIIEIHIVGTEKKSSENLFYYGHKTYEEYHQIACSCDIGIGSLALHRYNLNEACTLKSREYLAFGLPIIIAYEDTAFFKKDVDFIYKLPNCEDNINAKSALQILEFAKTNKNKVVQFFELNSYIDVAVIEEKKIDYLKGHLLND